MVARRHLRRHRFIAEVVYFILTWAILAASTDTHISDLLRRSIKGWVSMGLYALGLALAFVEPLLGYDVYTLVAIMWFIPDRRLAKSGDVRTE